MKQFVVIILLLLSGITTTLAQGSQLRIIPVDSGASEVIGNYSNSFDNNAGAISFLGKLIPQLQERGYLSASVDSIASVKDTTIAYVYVGNPYKWAQLSFGNIPVAMLNELGISEADWTGRPLAPKRMAALTQKLLGYCEDNGYPFATVYLDSIRHNQDGIAARLVLDRGDQMKIDSVIIKGDVNISKPFLLAYLDIHDGDLYNEKALRSIRKKLRELPYLQETQPWELDFSIGENKLYLYLEDKKANQINGLIGLQPNTDETRRFMLTADILLSLKNALSYGESLSLTFQQTQYQSPRFLGTASWPYLFGTKVGIDGDFELFKRDTTYYRTTLNAGLRYQFNATDYTRIFYNQNSNRVFSPDLDYVKANKALPPDMDVKSNGVGVAYSMARTDYRLNPRKGFDITFSATGLVRNVRKNDAITSLDDGSGFNYASLYDTVKQNVYQLKIAAEGNYYIPLWKNIIAKLSYHGGYLSGDNLFQNELFQLGGFRLLRGFDEQSLYVNQYHVATAELHLLLDQNSYFYIFNDDGYTTTRFQNVKKTDVPIGIGAGITLETKTGIFSVAFAVGKHKDAPFQFRQTKIHFGYVAYF